MNIRVIYFASARDLASVRSEELEVAEGSTLEKLAANIFRLHPPLGKMERSLKFSINLELGEVDRPLHEGDEIGVLPPVAGG